MKTMKKIFCIFLVVFMCLTSAPLQGFVKLEWHELPEFNFGEWFSSTVQAAEALTYGDFMYVINDGGTATITDYIGCEASVVIPNSINGVPVTEIGQWSLNDNSIIQTIVIPKNIAKIYGNAFRNSTNLISIEVVSDNPFYTSENGVIFNKDKTVLICYPNGKAESSYVVPDSVVEIGPYAFYTCSLTDITIGSSVSKIGEDAFAYNSKNKTKNVYINDLEAWCKIDFETAFSNPLRNVYDLPDSNFYKRNHSNLYINNVLVTNLLIPDSTTEIKDYAFYNCWSINSVTIPNNIGSIGDFAFSDCGNLSNIIMGNGVETIGDYAFSECYNLINLNLGNGVKLISSHAFDSCSNLKNITMGSKIETIGASAFVYCRSLTSITIPDSVTKIENGAFESCSELKSITIPDSVTSISSKTFAWCSNLVNITFSNSITNIEKNAFEGCKSLTNVVIPNCVTNIEDSAFRSCGNLESIVIPNSVISIGEYAFYNTSITDVYYKGKEEQWKKVNIHYGNNSLLEATIHYNSSTDEPLPELKLNFEELTISNNVCPSIYVESYPDGVTKEDIVWTSSNERVAYINGSTVNPIQYGKTLITASTKDGKYSASCELTVQSSFVITSTTSSLSSIKAGEEAEYSIMLMDYEGNKLPVENVALSNESSKYLEIIKHERTETEIKLTVKGLKAGTAVLEFDNDEPLTYSKFVFDIYPATVTYRADKVPVRNEELKTNFSRAGLFVENFRYFAVGEPAEYYTALMNVYNKNSSVGIVASYTQDGKLYDIAEIKKHQAMPTDYFEFLSVLGKGAVDIALGNNYNYRYSIESTKTEIEIDVPINGYITVSNDVTSCPVTFVYGIMSVAVSTAFQLAEDLTSIEKSKESDVVKELTKKVTNYFTKDPKILDKFIKELSEKILKETTKSNITFMGEYTLDLACKIFAEIELNFEDVLKDVLLEVLKDSAHNFVSMALMKTFLSNDIIKTAEGGYIKAAEAMFTVADNVNVIDEIIDFTHSAKSGITTITFGKCNEDGFVCKDVIRVNLKEEQEILDSLYLQHYQIYIDKNLFPLRPGFKDLDLKENSVIEVHEITIMRDGVPYEIKQKASVEIDIPDNWTIFNFRIYRVEPDGKITNMFATVANGKAYFITDHFSEYIFVGELEADHTHSYTLKTIEPTHTQKGIKTFTCICGDTYTEEIEKLKEHTFGDKDEKCDCGFDRTEGCSCNCHKGGISGFFFKIILFFQKLFKSNQICKCGIKHY